MRRSFAGIGNRRTDQLQHVLPFRFEIALLSEVAKSVRHGAPGTEMTEERRPRVMTGLFINVHSGKMSQISDDSRPVKEKIFVGYGLASGCGFKPGFANRPRHVAKGVTQGWVGNTGNLLEFNTRGDATKLARARLDSGNDLFLGHKTPQGKALRKSDTEGARRNKLAESINWLNQKNAE